jgi:hypothetical protein
MAREKSPLLKTAAPVMAAPNHQPAPFESPAEVDLENDPIASATSMVGLLLWLLCALSIVAFALVNYLLNWFAR